MKYKVGDKVIVNAPYMAGMHERVVTVIEVRGNPLHYPYVVNSPHYLGGVSMLEEELIPTTENNPDLWR